MLSASEFSVGGLADASGLSIMLPRNRYEQTILVSSVEGTPVAIFLDGEFRFVSFGCAGNTDWNGIIVPNVSIEVDEASLLDGDGGRSLGAMVRSGTTLAITSRDDNRRHSGSVLRVVASELVACREHMVAIFTRWQVVIGHGREKRILKAIDSSEVSAI